jgi:hypothetical protein
VHHRRRDGSRAVGQPSAPGLSILSYRRQIYAGPRGGGRLVIVRGRRREGRPEREMGTHHFLPVLHLAFMLFQHPTPCSSTCLLNRPAAERSLLVSKPSRHAGEQGRCRAGLRLWRDGWQLLRRSMRNPDSSRKTPARARTSRPPGQCVSAARPTLRDCAWSHRVMGDTSVGIDGG